MLIYIHGFYIQIHTRSTKAQLTIIKKTTKTYYNLSYRLCVKNLKIESNQEKEEKKRVAKIGW